MKYVDPFGLQAATFGEEITVIDERFLFFVPTGFANFLGFSAFLRNLGSFNSGVFAAAATPQRPTISTSPQCQSLISQPAHPDADLAANIQEAQKHQWNLLWLVNQVKTNGAWHYKRGGQLQFEAFGNFHYGVVFSAAGITPEISLLGAGAYQVLSGTSKAEWVFPHGADGLFDPANPFDKPFLHFPFGDEPPDALNIMQGITFFEECVQ